MADQAWGPLVTDPNQPGAPSYRPFRDRPSGIFIQQVMDAIRETGQPESIAALYRGKINRAETFRTLRKVTIDRRKRPNGDKAPCPRCGCDDKFLEGAFAWFPDLQFCAVIGRCCADHEALSEAEREFRWRKKRDDEEEYLLAGLPKLAAKAEALQLLLGRAGEALEIFRQFRRGAPAVHQHLRQIKNQRGGELAVIEKIEGAVSDVVGPAGFKRGSRVRSREIEFGPMVGLTAVSKDYNPVKQIETALRVLDSFDLRPTEEEALELICGWTESERHRSVAVAVLKELDRGSVKARDGLADFWAFFSRSNIERLNAYGTHSDCPMPFSASLESNKQRTLVTIIHRRLECRLSFASAVTDLDVGWPV